MRPIPLPQKLTVLVVVIVPFLATILALGLLWKRAVHWSDFALLAMMYTLVGLGVTAGFHRMLTHRSFRPHPIVKGIMRRRIAKVIRIVLWKGSSMRIWDGFSLNMMPTRMCTAATSSRTPWLSS